MLRKQRLADLSEIEASLVYTGSSRSARVGYIVRSCLKKVKHMIGGRQNLAFISKIIKFPLNTKDKVGEPQGDCSSRPFCCSLGPFCLMPTRDPILTPLNFQGMEEYILEVFLTCQSPTEGTEKRTALLTGPGSNLTRLSGDERGQRTLDF